MTQIKLHNSLTRKKEDFIPVNPEHVRLYACGPTVYSYAHIGNGRAAVVFDLLARVLKTIYPKVTYVSNITDIEDKIIKAAKEQGKEISEITELYAKIFNDDMYAIGVNLPDIQPKATEFIKEIQKLIASLIEKGHAYENDGHVLFNVPSYQNYGALSGRSRDEQIAGARVEVAPYKKDPADFVLWKPSVDDEPGWDSPWGKGRPGWHIECSAMSGKILGLPFDIHGGGADLKFPHHENEIAQSCCAHDFDHDSGCNHGGENPADFAKYWVHNGFLTVNGEKMSKSLGNVILVHDLLKDVKGEVIRYNLLSAHYRQPLNWTDDSVKQSEKTLERLYKRMFEIENELELADGFGDEFANYKDSKYPEEFMNALCDDMNTPKALAELGVAVKKASDETDKNKKLELYKGIKKSADLLGVLNINPKKWLEENTSRLSDDIDANAIESLINERNQARKDKNFARADEIRNELSEKGIAIEDTPQGTKWHVAG